MILAPSQYQEAVARNEGFSQFMESVFVSLTLLFPGCRLKGIQDYLGVLRLRWSSRRHYALLGVEGELWETKAAYVLDRCGIQVSPQALGSDQVAMDAFIESLHQAVAQRQCPEIRPEPAARAEKGGSDGGLLREVRLQNIGAFKDPPRSRPQLEYPAGDNGVGKSTVLKAIALVFCGREGRDYAERLLMAGQTSGQITARTDRQTYVVNLSRTGSGVEVTSLPDRPLEIEGWLALGFPALRTLTWRAARVGTDDVGGARPVPQDLIPLLAGDPDPRLDDVEDWIPSLDYWLRTAGAESVQVADFRAGLFDLLADVARTPGLRFDRVVTAASRWGARRGGGRGLAGLGAGQSDSSE